MFGAAVGSLALLFRAGQRQGTQRPLLLLMAVWVVAPFVGLGWAFLASKRWPGPNRVALFLASLVISSASLVVYSFDAFQPAKAPAGFRFVLAPAVSWLIIIVIAASASLSARKRS